jgi:hypothetical protein
MPLAAAGKDLPSAVTVDVGLLHDPGTGREDWAVVEANVPWFANSYAADPDRVLDMDMDMEVDHPLGFPFAAEASGAARYRRRRSRGRRADVRRGGDDSPRGGRQ